MKKLTAILFSLLLVFTLASGASASSTPSTKNSINKITFNEIEGTSKGYYVYETGDEIYLPIRETFELVGYIVEWYSAGRTVSAEKYGDLYSFENNSDTLYVNDEPSWLYSETKNIDNKLYIELYDFEDILSVDVQWDKQNKTLAITQQTTEGLFWKIENGDKVVYFLGSIHVGDDGLYPIRDEVERAFYLSDKLILEVDLSQGITEDVAEKLDKLQLIEEGKSLKDLIPAETYSRLQLLLKTYELEEDTLDEFQPWVVELTLSSIITTVSNYNSQQGIDLYFMQKALRQDKEIGELESVLLQYEKLASFSDEYTIRNIDELLDVLLAENLTDELQKSFDEIDKLIEIWKKGSDDALIALIEEFKKEEQEQYKIMILERHGLMLEKIESYLNDNSDDTYFVIAGYLHSLGPDGLITLLKEKGYKVTRQ